MMMMINSKQKETLSTACSSSSSWSSPTHVTLTPLTIATSHEITSTSYPTRDFESNLSSNSNLNVGAIQTHYPTASSTFPMYTGSNYGLASADQHSVNSELTRHQAMRGAETTLPFRGNKIVNYPRCAKCQNHGQYILLKNHKRYCAWKDCHCEKCTRTNERKRAKAEHEANRRWKKVEEELGLSVTRHLRAQSGSLKEECPLLASLLTGSRKPEWADMSGQANQ